MTNTQLDKRRVPMNVHPDVRARLRDLLFRDEMTGVGYSAFLAAAMDAYDRGDWSVGVTDSYEGMAEVRDEA